MERQQAPGACPYCGGKVQAVDVEGSRVFDLWIALFVWYCTLTIDQNGSTSARNYVESLLFEGELEVRLDDVTLAQLLLPPIPARQ
ncbi:hypothetical protein RJ639_037122 [Escallonia herrerae]|uniref:Uncharacterized protein n=1 Tax=Escallonia herrerae TaxID=1293975 RepID=A0AA88WQ49_9ASTE|nr:hypothetical protein RJ639_037122 [Escallonia herrerae]